MPFIHSLPAWPAFTWSDAALAPLLAAARHKQGRLLGRVESLGFELRRQAGLEVLISDVIKSSAIEGEVLDYDSVRSSIARRLGIELGGMVPADRHVEGVVEMMLDATQRFDSPLTAERLYGWHAALFPTGRSGMLRITVGAWRPPEAGPMQVVSGPIGREKVHFEAPAADRLTTEMDAFLHWFNAPSAVDPVLRAGIAHLWFVTIHPFEDGNGRIARAIADMALARADGSKDRFYSMSAQIESQRSEYYRRLETTQRGSLDITGWLLWFVECFEQSILGADGTIATVLYHARLWRLAETQPLSDRQRRVLTRLLDNFKGHLTSSKYAKLAGCSHDTALRDIQELLSRGLVVRNEGSGRSTSYRLVTDAELRVREPGGLGS